MVRRCQRAWSRWLSPCAVLLVSLFLFLPVGAQANEPRRVALVVGNSNYKIGADLRNPVADAADMQVALQRLGFKLVVGQDLALDEFEAKLREFRETMRKADVALFFYAGHAVQFKDENYLLPTDITELKSEDDVLSKSVALNRVIEEMGSYAKSSIILLDACRDSPSFQTASRGPLLGTQMRVRFGSGLARIQAGPADRFVGFAAAPGTVAQDGKGKNSPFTEALLRHIAKPDTDIGTIFSLVRGEVIRTTRGRQQPEALNALSAPIVLRSSPAGAGSQWLQPGTPPPEETAAWISQDADLWLAIRDSTDPRHFEDYLQQFPRGRYASLARRKLDQLRTPARPSSEADATPAPVAPDGDLVVGLGGARVSGDLPRREAVRAATAQARAMAIASKVALAPGTVATGAVTTSRQAAQLTELIGRALPYDEAIIVSPDDGSGEVRVEVRIRLRKLPAVGERRLTGVIEPQSIAAGEPLQFKVTVRRDSSIGVFAWQADGSVVRLYPEAAGKPVVMKSGQSLWFPRAGDQIARISSAPMPGERSNHEALIVVGAGSGTAFDELVPFGAGQGSAVPGIPQAEFLNRLAALPESDLEVVALGYEVRR